MNYRVFLEEQKISRWVRKQRRMEDPVIICDEVFFVKIVNGFNCKKPLTVVAEQLHY